MAQVTRVLQWIVVVSLGYVMFRPVSHNGMLLSALAAVFLASAGIAVLNRQKLAWQTITVLAIAVGLGIYGTLIGLSNPGVANGALVWIVAPVLYGAFVWAGSERLIRLVLAASAWITVVIAAIALIYVAFCVAGMRDSLPRWIVNELGLAFGLSSGVTSITFYSLSTLVATAPMWLTAIVLPRHALLPPKWLSALAGATAFLASLVAGRAAITIVTIAVPILVWIVWRIYSHAMPRRRWVSLVPILVGGGAALTVAALAILGNQSVPQALGRVLSLVTGSGRSLGDRIRAEESVELIRGWLDSPVFGHGLGATIEGYARNATRPWNFELQYHLILFQLGIVGAIGILACATVAVIAVLRAFRSSPRSAPVLFVTLAGAAALLIANASNPYMQAPGNVWSMYLALMVVNVSLTRMRPAQEVQSQSTTIPVPETN